MMEVSGRNHAGGDTTTDVHCDPCLLLNKHVNAGHYCLDCDEFFCNSCSSVHHLFKLSKNHKLLSRDEMPRQKTASTEENVCSKHSRERLNYFCKVHNNFACTLCITLEHRNCSIQHIDELAADYANNPEYRSLKEKVSSLLQKMEGMKKISARNNQDLQTIYSQFVSDVKALRSEINNRLDSMEATILKEAQDVKKSDIKAVQTVSTACDTVTTDVNKIVTDLEKHEHYKQHRHLVISAKKAKIQIRDCEKKIDDTSCQNKIRNYKLHKNQKVLQALQSMYSLGTLVDKDMEANKTMKKRTKKEETKRVYSEPTSLSAYYEGDINVKHRADEDDCWIKGGEMIDSYRIALTDGNNNAIKIVNVDSKCIISYLKLAAEPFDGACIDKNQLVVTCNDTLVFVNVGKTLTLDRKIPLYGECRGIIFNDDELFVAFTSPEPVIKLISLTGEILKTFSTDKNGQPLFNTPSYICLSHDRSKLFVTDCKTDTVISLDLDVDDHTIYRDSEFGHPCGLTTDKSESFVSDFKTQKVVSLDSDVYDHTVYRDSEFVHPCGLTTDRSESFVSDFKTQKVVSLDSDVYDHTVYRDSEFVHPCGLTTDKSESFVSDLKTQKVVSLDSDVYDHTVYRDSEFVHPCGLTTDKSESFVSDLKTQKVVSLDSDVYDHTVYRDSEFVHPCGLITDKSESFVSDLKTQKVVSLDSDVYDHTVYRDSEFVHPCGLTTDRSESFVSDFKTDTVMSLDLDVYDHTVYRDSEFVHPCGLTTDKSESFVSDFKTQKVVSLDSDVYDHTVYRDSEFVHPCSLTTDKSESFVSDFKTGTVMSLDLDVYDHTVYRDSEFVHPCGLTTDKSESFVSDLKTQKVVSLDSDVYDHTVYRVSEFVHPCGLITDKSESFVSDFKTQKVVSLDSDVYDHTVYRDSEFVHPCSLTTDKSESFVSDFKTDTVMSLDLDVDDHTVYRDSEFVHPCGLTTDKYGNVYVASKKSSKIYQISPKNRSMKIFLDRTQGREYPQSITYIGEKDKLYISNVGSKRNVLTVYQLQRKP